jgi:hypothetical protein
MYKNTLVKLTFENEEILKWLESFNIDEEIDKVYKILKLEPQHTQEPEPTTEEPNDDTTTEEPNDDTTTEEPNDDTTTQKPEKRKYFVSSMGSKVEYIFNSKIKDSYDWTYIKKDFEEIQNIPLIRFHEEATPKQENKLLLEVKRNKTKSKPLKFVDKFDRLRFFNDIDEQTKYFYIAKQIINYNGKPSYKFCELNMNILNNFIEEYLNYNNNLFEVIRPYSKVKLFFDLEYKLKTTPDNYDEEANNKLNKFVQFLKLKAYELLKIELHQEDLIILNSCYIDKISFHIIINKIVFENMETMKTFINHFIYILSSDPYYNDLVNFVDHGVYTKNRNFRFINQSKITNNTTLKNNNVQILKTFVTVHENVNNFIKLDDIKHLEISKITTTKPKKDKQKKEIIINPCINIYSSHFEALPKINLKLIKNMSNDDLKKLSYWKQYLYLINQPLNWTEYNKICCAVASCDGSTVEDFKEWARLHPDYNENDEVIETFDKKKNYNNVKKYNIGSLRKLAKICDPDFFKHCPAELNNILVDLNIDGYEVIKEDTKYIDETNKILYYNVKFIAIMAAMGKGKTNFIGRYLTLYPEKSILYISTRRSFADFITGEEYKNIGFVNYQDFKGQPTKEITKYKKIVCSLESLQDIKEIEKFDIIILDESETILNQLDSSTMKGVTILNYNLLCFYINNSEKVFVADAFIMNRTINFINNFTGEKALIINDKHNTSRTATEVHEDLIFDVLIKSINKGENNFCCFGSQSKLRKFMHKIIEMNILKRDEIIHYTSTSDDNKTKKTLNNINGEWVKYRLVLTTPTITVGCSFTQLFFHNTFIISYPSCSVRDLFQTHMRARNLINNTVYYCIPEPKKYNFIRSQTRILLNIYDNFTNETDYKYNLHLDLLEKYETNIKNNKLLYANVRESELYKLDIYKNTFIKNVVSEIPEEIKQIKQYNLLERILNGLHYKYMFIYYLKRCNYNLVDLVGNYEKITFDDEYIEIDNYIITPEAAKEIEEKEKLKQATEADKYNLDKYYFYNFLNLTTKTDINEEDFNKLYIDFWHNKFNQSKLKNTKSELLDRLDINKNGDIKQNKKLKFTKDDINDNIFRLGIVKDVKEILNIKSTVEKYNISRDSINKLISYYSDKMIIDNKEITQREYIYNVFNIDKNKQSQHELNFKSTFEFTNLIFNNWNGSKMKGDVNNKDRKGIYNSYITTNDIITDFNEKIQFDIVDLFNNDKNDENDEIEGDKDQEINIINYNIYSFDDIDE